MGIIIPKGDGCIYVLGLHGRRVYV